MSSNDLAKADKRMVVYIQANIHAGEVEGKEASLMLARDIVLDPAGALTSTSSSSSSPRSSTPTATSASARRTGTSQPGPEQGVGVRHNGQNLDLNRDAMKLESPEVRGARRATSSTGGTRLLVVDCHTTDGAYHQES